MLNRLFSARNAFSSRDLEEYRAHYPKNTDDPRLNKNLLFFRNEYPLQPEGVLISEVLKSWKGRYRHLESSHSFIQWLFPIQEKGMNWDSQVLQKHEIASMRADPVILERVVGVFRIMLDFYGMELVDPQKGVISRLPKGSFEPQYRNLNHSSHNYLRITRILKNLGEMGFEHLKLAWLEFLFEEICITRLLPNCEGSFANYWVGTIYDDQTRESFMKHCKDRLKAATDAKTTGGKVSSAVPFSSSASASASPQRAPSSNYAPSLGSEAPSQNLLESLPRASLSPPASGGGGDVGASAPAGGSPPPSATKRLRSEREGENAHPAQVGAQSSSEDDDDVPLGSVVPPTKK